jgi:hypothetical protein
VTLDGGGAAYLSTPLAGGAGLGFDAAGVIHGQLWLRLPAASDGTLRVQTTTPAPGGSDHFDIPLGGLAADVWHRVWLRLPGGGDGRELTTDGSASPGEVRLVNPGPDQIRFYAWGLVLTQIAGGGDLGTVDPGPEMYDGSLAVADWNNAIDMLELPPIAASTAGQGFCLSADAQPAAGLPWNASFARRRTILKWTSATQEARLELDGGQVCFAVTGLGSRVCFSPLSGTPWTPGTKHNVKGCVSAAGVARIYADGQQVPVTLSGAAVTELQGGRLYVGGDPAYVVAAPFQGFVSKALACRDDVVNCN